MVFDVLTIFPGFFQGMLEQGLLKRAIAAGHVEVRRHDLRDFTEDRHRSVDDRPFGGGPGMVFKPEPIFRAVEALREREPAAEFPVILLSPQGRLLTQAVAEELAEQKRLVLISGRYEAVDERVAEHLATDELSIGDYILSGGELAAAVVIEVVTRLLPGVLGNEASRELESFAHSEGLGDGCRHGILDHPHYTRPADFRGLPVPEILLSGDHDQIRRWRRRQALAKTWRRRPDLLRQAALREEDRLMLEAIRKEDADLRFDFGSPSRATVEGKGGAT